MQKNTLSTEKSPYLQQHKHDPVWWQIWGAEALAAAKKQNKPILLSIGYSACHWCHVMAYESFQNPQTADLMNKFFINIKVDREERPDLDALYQEALHLFGRQGGWPLTMFLTPDGKPFFGGTYFPEVGHQHGAYSHPSFKDVLWQVARFWREDNQNVLNHSQKVFEGLQVATTPKRTEAKFAAEKCVELAQKLFLFIDADLGGFGKGAKFANVPQLQLLWAAAQSGTLPKKEAALLEAAVRLTLDNICKGGLYDHLGGGFFRYTVDGWRTPHFEKMLEDSALLIELLTEVWQKTKSPLYKTCVFATVTWLNREMKLAKSAFATALSADTDSADGGEGAYYLWSAVEVNNILNGDDKLGHVRQAFFKRYTLDPTTASQQHMHLELVENFSLKAHEHMAQARQTLLAARQKRPKPLQDDKILVEANAFTIRALAKAGYVFGQKSWLKMAQKAYAFIEETHLKKGILYHSWCKGQLQPHSFAEGYSACIAASLALYEAGVGAAYLQKAQDLTLKMVDLFEDATKGGFFQTPKAQAGDALLLRKPARDGVTPSANGLMVQNCAKLYHITGNRLWRGVAERTFKAFSGAFKEEVFPNSSFLLGKIWLEAGSCITVYGGVEQLNKKLAEALRHIPLFAKNIAYKEVLQAEQINDQGEDPTKEGPTKEAYITICRNHTCSTPMSTLEALQAYMAQQ